MLIIILLLSAIKELKLEVSFFLPLAPTVNYSFSSAKQMGILYFIILLTLKEKKVKMSTPGAGLMESGPMRTLLVQSLIISLHKSFKYWRPNKQHFINKSLLFTCLKKGIKQYNPAFTLLQNLVPVFCFFCFPLCIVLLHLSCSSTITCAPVLRQDTQHSWSSGNAPSFLEELGVCLPAMPPSVRVEGISRLSTIFIRIQFED